MSVASQPASDRRVVHYDSWDNLLADLDSLEGRKLKTLGKWSAGRIFAHLAVPMNGAIDGMKFAPPWYFKILGRAMKKQFLTKPARPGINLPKETEAYFWPEVADDAEGFAVLRAAIARLKAESKRMPNPLLGKLTNEEWDKFLLRHAELHMGFIVPE